MGLPLPRVVADVGPGGPLVTALGGINSLANDNILRQINQIKKQYAPITAQSEAASKLAYANLMGPQFLAKIMGNDSALGNMSEEQKRNALKMIYQAGTGQGTGNALMQGGHPTGIGQPGTNSLSGWFADKLKGAFGATPQKNAMAMGGSASNPGQFNGDSQYASPPSPRQPPGQMPGQMTGLDPGRGHQEYNPEGEDPINHEVDAAFTEWLQSPEGKAEIAKGEAANMPSEQEILEWKRRKDGQPMGSPSMEMELTGGQQAPRQPTYAENTGAYKGIVEEGQESGKIRAKQREELDNTIFNAETNQQTLDEVSDILGSPEFEEIRNVPLAGHHELSYYAKEGTPAQQQMVGRFYTLTGNLIKDASRDFAGQFRKGEQQLLNGMKPGPSDTVDSAKGKTESLSVLNKMLTQRARLTSHLMDEYHVSKLQASEMADKKVNGNAIRKEVHDRLNPKRANPSNDDIDFTAQKYGMTRQQVIDRLKSEGKYNG